MRETLGESPSDLFYGRVDRALEQTDDGVEGMRAACARVQAMVNLFIDEGKAAEVARRFAEILADAQGDP